MIDQAILEALHELRDALRGLPQAIAAAVTQKSHARRLSSADEAALAALLPVITAAIEGRPFLVCELTQHAKLNFAPAIALGKALASTNPRSLGRLLSRGCGINIGGYRIRKINFSERNGIRWTVECDNWSTQKHAKFDPPRRIRI
jgi:hypothetical protein